MRRIAILLAALLAVGCGEQKQELAPTASTLRDYRTEQLAYLEKLTPAEGWQKTPSGLRYRRIKGDGTGPKPKPTDTVTLHYFGKLTDGTQFDSSLDRGQPTTMPLGEVVRGWQEGVPLISVGDTYEFAIPAELAYGDREAGPIPPHSTLLFTIGLIGIVPEGQASAG